MLSEPDTSVILPTEKDTWCNIRNFQTDKPPILHEFEAWSGPTWTPTVASPVSYFDNVFEPIPGSGDGTSLWDAIVTETNNYYMWNLAKAGVLPQFSKMLLLQPLNVEK